MKPFLSIILLVVTLSGCAVTPSDSHESEENVVGENTDPRDPLESVNRSLWYLNWDILDRYLLRPVTLGYTYIMPDVARTGVRNAVQNLEEPTNSLNSFLQGKGQDGIESLARFAVNSTLGLLGLVDVASELGLTRKVEDLDETLAVWGVESGPFLMVPLLGPNDTRGLIGDIGDNINLPYALLNTPLNLGRFVLNAIENRASLMSQEAQINQSLDPYTFVKDVYIQNKAFTIRDGQPPAATDDDEMMDDFDDFEDSLDDVDGDD